jgi:hypothetical protein
MSIDENPPQSDAKKMLATIYERGQVRKKLRDAGAPK